MPTRRRRKESSAIGFEDTPDYETPKITNSFPAVELREEKDKKLIPDLEDLFPHSVALLAITIPGLTNFVIFNMSFLNSDWVPMLIFSLVYSFPYFILTFLQASLSTRFFSPMDKGALAVCAIRSMAWYYIAILVLIGLSSFGIVDRTLFNSYLVFVGAMVFRTIIKNVF
ncbi:MAG: hypothetical protein WC350_04820 [Candidatus Micrarchaeia archaeon]|jgi:hypothetical protein